MDDAVNRVPKVSQRPHVGRKVYGLASGVPVQAVPRHPVDADFARRPVTPGSFVITRPAPAGPWAKTAPKMAQLDYWLWQVRCIIEPGGEVPGFTKVASKWVYVAQLFQPKGGGGCRGSWAPMFCQDRAAYMLTEEEKRARKHRRVLWGLGKARQRRTRDASSDDEAPDDGVVAPVTCYLRPENIIGGGFGCTPRGSVPEDVQKYVLVQLASA